MQHNKVSNVASEVLRTKQKELTFVCHSLCTYACRSYDCTYMIMNAYMTRFGGFLCTFVSTEHALYLLELDNTTCQMQIFDTKIFLLIIHFHIF